MFLPKSCDRAEYYGYGPTESYCDKRHGTRRGLYQTTAKDNQEDYVKPQENGSHFGCDFVTVADERGAGLCVRSDTPFSMSLSPYTQEELTLKKHNFELAESEYAVLCADYGQSGLGSNSCGPELAEKYRLNETEFTFSLRVNPVG
jgi:beta-galactosidase